jgi:anaerobic selenocysteine-containing dehydrogenase
MTDTIEEAAPDIRVHQRFCPFCEQNCATEITADHTNHRVVSVRGDKQDPLSKGFICPKAVAIKDLHEDPDVLTGPLVKRNGVFEPATWEEAIAVAAEGIQRVQARHGRDGMGFFFGSGIAHIPGLTLYTPGLLASLGTRQIYSTSSVDCHPHFLTAVSMFGGAPSLPVPDIDNSDYFVLIGANPMQSNGSFMTAPGVPRRLKAIQARGGKVVVVDPRRSETAAMADWYLSVRPGGDAALLFAVVHTLFAEGLVRLGHIEAYARNLDEVRRLAERFPPEVANKACGIPADDIRKLAREIAAAPRACVYGRIGSTMQQFGSLTSWLIVVVNALTGNLDSEGGSMFPKGVFEAILMSERAKDGVLPQGRHHSRVSGYPELAGQFPVSALIEEMETPGEGQIRGMITMCGNPALSLPNGGARLTKAFENLEFMVSFDIYVNETTRHADVILPSPRILYHSDFMIFFTFLTVRDYLRYCEPVFEAPAGTWHDSDAICHLVGLLEGISPHEAEERALKMLFDQLRDQGNPVIARHSFDQVRQYLGGEHGQDRMCDLLVRSGAYGDHFGENPEGLTLAKLKESPHGVDFGSMKSRMREVIHHVDGRIDFAPAVITRDVDRLEEWITSDQPAGLQLLGRRQVRSYNTWMHNFPVLAKGPELCLLMMNPDDAAERDIVDGQMVRIRSRTGAVQVRVELSDSLRRGVVSLPHGWGHDEEGVPGQVNAKRRPGVNFNHLADELLIDVPSGNTNLNCIPVEVESLPS